MAGVMALAYDAGMDSIAGTTLDTDRDSVLETVLGAYRMRVEITADVRYCGTWYDQEPATRFGQFHLLTEGTAAATAPGRPHRVPGGCPPCAVVGCGPAALGGR